MSVDVLFEEAMNTFEDWLDEAKRGVIEPTAMILSSADPDGRISSRTVLLKGLDRRGFVFYTNLASNKGRQLKANPIAGLCFLWKPLMKQVQIEGSVELVSDEEADAYFASRPRGSQIGAWASRQSHPLESREALEGKVADIERRFEGQQVPRPDFWSGFRLRPRMIEFWHGLEHRLHERWRYEQVDGAWTKTLLNP